MKKNVSKMSIKINAKKTLMIVVLLSLIVNIVSIPITTLAATKYTQTVKSGIYNFPKEYQEALNKIKKDHPNWSFDAYYTGISWNDLLANETDHGHNRVIKSAESSWKCSCGNVASGYACASAGITAYYLDPRNFLDDVSMFQFLEISYNPNVHKLEGIETSVKNTFLDNKVTLKIDGKEKTMSYAEIILEAAKESNMSPYSIRTKIIQEVGTKGSSSVTGTYEGYEGYYNFFNYGAYDSGNAIENGLKYAKNAGWDNQYTAIVEGAKLLADAYTNAGQNTAYFYKWDVVGNKILKPGETQTFNDKNYFFRHQYMTNVQDPKSQSKTLFNLYTNIGILNEHLNFIIPIYEDMPEKPVGLPTNIVQNDDTLIYYVTDADGINVRKEPTTSGERLCGINKDTKVIVLEKNVANANGYSWHKIKLESGVIGYVASAYVAYYSGDESKVPDKSKPETPTTDPKPVETIITNKDKTVKIDKTKKIITTTPEITVKIVIESLGVKKYTVTDANNKQIKDTDLVGTGYKITDTDNKITYNVIKMGDSNGDGKISSADYVRIKNIILNKVQVTNEQMKAADANNDGKVSSADYVRIKNFILKKAEIKL